MRRQQHYHQVALMQNAHDAISAGNETKKKTHQRQEHEVQS